MVSVDFGIDHQRHNIRGGDYGSSEVFGWHPTEVASYIAKNGFGVNAYNSSSTRTCEEVGRILYAFDCNRFGDLFYSINAKHFKNEGGLTFYTGYLQDSQVLFAMVIRSRAFSEENVIVVGFTGTRGSYGSQYYNITGFGVSFQPWWNATYASAASQSIGQSSVQLARVGRSGNLLLVLSPNVAYQDISQAVDEAISYRGQSWTEHQSTSSSQALSSSGQSKPTEPSDGEKYYGSTHKRPLLSRDTSRPLTPPFQPPDYQRYPGRTPRPGPNMPPGYIPPGPPGS